MSDIFLNNIEKYYGAKRVLKDVSFQLRDGERVGIVGRNGCGKTSLFKILAGVEVFSKGSINISKGSKIGYLEQIPNYPDDYRSIDVLSLAFKEELELQAKLNLMEKNMSGLDGDSLELMVKEYGELQEKFDRIGGYSIKEKLSKISTGLNLEEKILDSKFNDLSGGEKTRILLGKILLEGTEILLLDEPTNHLDMDSMTWLEEYLCEYKGLVIIISHDRYFLDSVVDKIIEIVDGKANSYFGNYTYYLEEKERLYVEDLKKYENQQKKIKSMEESIKRMKDWADRGDNESMFKRAFNMEKRLDRMEKIDRPKSDDINMKLEFNLKDRSGQDALVIENLYKSFGDKTLFKNLNHTFKYGDRVSIIGHNGSGKTSLLKIILGEIEPDKGHIKLGSNVKLGYLEQNISFKNEEGSILNVFREDYICSEAEGRKILAKFLFYGEEVFKKVKSLSGGERARLRLCQLMYKDINTLILDEPTNHLDIASREMLEASLEDFKGSIIFVSHDRYFINKLAEEVLELKKEKITSYLGNYDYFMEKKIEYKYEEEIKGEKIKSKSEIDYLENKKKNSLEKSTLKKIKKLEERISEYEHLIEEKDLEIEENASDYDKLSLLYNEKLQLEEKLNEFMDEWMLLSEY